MLYVFNNVSTSNLKKMLHSSFTVLLAVGDSNDCILKNLLQP